MVKGGDRSQCSRLLEISAIVRVLGDRLFRDLRGWILIFEDDRSLLFYRFNLTRNFGLRLFIDVGQVIVYY